MPGEHACKAGSLILRLLLRNGHLTPAVGSKRPRASEISETPAPLVPLEDMPDPKKQLELREVIIVSSRDSSSTIRTTTNILLMHSQQLLHAARDVDAPLPLDCLPSTMGILEKLFWAEPWEDPVKGLTNEVCTAVFMLAIIISFCMLCSSLLALCKS